MGSPKIKQVFDMDSSLMLHEARYLREKGMIHFNGTPLKNPPRPFLGAAINPFSQPENVPILRLKQKIAAGADFVQTQAIFDIERFTEFMERYNQEGLGNDLFLLAGIPVLISEAALKMIPHIPGICFPSAVQQRFESSMDLLSEGIDFAKELAHKLRKMEGVAGIHLMLFGSDHSVLPGIVSDIEG
jgi:methylenetetrahydrofolate reductase (NADPH)